MPGVSVRILSGPSLYDERLAVARQRAGWEFAGERLNSTTSRADGWFYFKDLPDGDYALHFEVPAAKNPFYYGSGQLAVTVPQATPVLVVELRPAGLTGRVVDAGELASGIRLARVQLEGTSVSCLTEGDGAFYLSGFEPGRYSVRISANGYTPVRFPVEIARGELLQAPEPFALTRLEAGEYGEVDLLASDHEPAPYHPELSLPSTDNEVAPVLPPSLPDPVPVNTPSSPAPAPAPAPTPQRLDFPTPDPPPVPLDPPPPPRQPEPFVATVPPDTWAPISLVTGFSGLDLRVPLWDWHEESSAATVAHTVRYLQEAIERMTGAAPDWYPTQGEISSGICLVLWEYAGPLQQDEDIMAALARSPGDPLAATEAFYIRTETARVIVAANTPDGLCAGVVALLDSVGYEVLGMGPNWTHVPDFHDKPLIFNLITAQRPSFYLRRLEAASGQGRGKGTLGDMVLLRSPDESTIKSYRRWLMGTRTYGRSTTFGYEDAASDAQGKTPKTEHRVLSRAESHDFGFEGIAPRWDVSAQAIAQELSSARDRGVLAFAGQIDLNFGKLGLVYYLFAKMLWDVTRTAADLEAARDRWFSLAFAGGAGKMKEYHDLLRTAGLTVSGPGFEVFSRAVALIDEARTAAATQEPSSEPTRQALRRIDDFKLIWYFHFLCDTNTEQTWVWLWKCQTSYMLATHPVAQLHWGTDDVSALVNGVQAGAADGPAHYTTDEINAWWPKVKAHWSAPASPNVFAEATLIDGSSAGDVDLNDLVAVRDFQRSPRSDYPLLFQLSVLSYGRTHISALQVAARKDDTLGFRLAWFEENRVDQVRMEIRFGLDRWDPTTRLWEAVIGCERRMSEPIPQFRAAQAGLMQSVDVRVPAPEPGTYRVRIGGGACSTYVGSLGHEPQYDAYSDVLPFTFSDANSGYTQSEAYMYIPRGATKLTIKAADTNPKTLCIMKADPDGALTESTNYAIQANTTEINLPLAETGSIALIRGDGFRLPRMYSIPTRWAKGPRALLIPRKIAEADKLTIIQPSTAKVDAFHAAATTIPPPSMIDVNDLVLVQELQVKDFNRIENDRPYQYHAIYYRPPAGFLIAHYAGERIGFSVAWEGAGGSQPYGIERWDRTNKVWVSVFDIAKTSQQTTPQARVKDGVIVQVATVKFVAPAPGTYRFTLGFGGGAALLASLAYDHANGEYRDRRGLTFFGLQNPQYTGLYVYIPKDSPTLDVTQVEETANVKEVQLYSGTPASGLRPSRKIDISAIKAHSIALERYETGTVAFISGFYHTPLITSVPNIWAKRPSVLAIPRQTAEKDGLTIIGPGPAKALAFAGDGSVLTFPDPTKLANPGDQTIEMWVRMDSQQESLQNLYVKQSDVEGRLGVNPDGKVIFRCGDAERSDSERATDLVLPLHEWLHLAVVTDRVKGEVRLYGNGTLRYSGYLKPGSVIDAAQYSSVPAYLGQNLAGTLCEVRIWKVARTPGEIEATWSRRLLPYELELLRSSLLAYLPLSGVPSDTTALEHISGADLAYAGATWAGDGPKIWSA